VPVSTDRAAHTLALVSFLALASAKDLPAQTTQPTPPPARRDDVREVLHGVEVVDPYRWLEDDRSAETRAWIDAQNRYAHTLLDGRPGREAIRERLTALSRYDVQSVPQRRGERYFIQKRRVADDLSILYVREGLAGPDEVLLDPHPLSPDHSSDVEVSDISADGRWVVYGLRRGGEDETELHVRDVARRADLPDVLPRGLYRGASLKPDGSGSITHPRVGRPACASGITPWGHLRARTWRSSGAAMARANGSAPRYRRMAATSC
jgi:prolyl oligopeptidase